VSLAEIASNTGK